MLDIPCLLLRLVGEPTNALAVIYPGPSSH
jgi:hypothetical protein